MSEKEELIDRLSFLERNGVAIYMDGLPASPVDIAECCCLREESTYMPDYVLSDRGELMQVRYDPILIHS